MKELHSTLPFTEPVFFYFLFAGVSLLFILKRIFPKRNQVYKYALAFINFVYLGLLFTKPFQIIGLILYTYLIYYLFARKWQYKKLLLPVILLSLPMIFMKTLNILPTDQPGALFHLAIIFQIAGISFLTFKVIQLYIDESTKKDTVSFIDYFNFTAFVPTLLIGPIDRFGRFNENVRNGFNSLSNELFFNGLDKIIKGLLYKFILAFGISRYFLDQLENDGSIMYHAGTMYGYLFYLFFDFAGYSLLAIGFGQMMGIHVPMNFDKPFLAVNPKDFWKRWHATLGDWLNDYFFKPIFKELTSKKRFKPIQRQNIALFLTFSLMGFWNGFELHFILSGMVFGLYSVIHNYYIYLCKKNGKDVFFGTLSPKWIRIISIFILFHAVAISIYIFSGKLNFIFE